MGGQERARLAGTLALGWSALIMLVGMLLLVALPLIGPDRSYCENPDHPGRCTSRLELAVPGAVVSAVGAWSVTASVGLLRRRRWARWAVAITFSAWGLGAFVGMINAATDEGPVDAGGLILAALFLAFFVTTAALAVDWGG